MGLTRWRELVFAAAVAAGGGYLAIRMLYRYFPPITLWAGLSLLLVAALEAWWAILVGGRIRDGRIGVGPGQLDPLAVARTVAVAKASAWAGAVMTGWWLAVVVYLAPRRAELRVAATDFRGAVVAGVSAAILVAVALWLQHTCASPAEPDGDPSNR